MLGGGRKRAHPVLRHRAADRRRALPRGDTASGRTATTGSPLVTVLCGRALPARAAAVAAGLPAARTSSQARRTSGPPAPRRHAAGRRRRLRRDLPDQACRSPASGPVPARACSSLPVVGWLLGQADLRAHRARTCAPAGSGLLAGGGVGAKIPEAVPGSPGETAAETPAAGAWPSSRAEQQSNSVFYAGPKGILGMGTRWGSWQLAEELVPRDAAKEIHPFRSWDVVRAIHDQLRMLERGPLQHRRLPEAVHEALDRLAHRRGRQGGLPARPARTSTPTRSRTTRYSASATSSSSATATGTTWASSSRSGTASWSSPC